MTLLEPRFALAVSLLIASIPAAIIDRQAEARDDYVEMAASDSRWTDPVGTGTGQSEPRLAEHLRAPVCRWGLTGSNEQIPCPGEPFDPLPDCTTTTLPPLWERTRPDPTTAWGPWQIIAPTSCAVPADITPAMVLAELRRLPLAPSGLVVQPDRGWVLVNKPTIVYTDPAPQTLTTTILGTPVTITATPTGYTWDFAEGAPLTTTSPGRPWPDGDIARTYTRTGTYAITLTTTWSATYTIADDPQVRDVPGTATTTSTTDPFVVQERRSHLVAETCTQNPDAPGC